MPRRLLVPALLAGAAAAPFYAVANIRGATPTYTVSGTVKFEQETELGDMTVTYDIRGLTDGEHGFHVHQFGDVQVTDTLVTMAAHFVPFCDPPRLDEEGNLIGGCQDDQVHGLPPSVRRQPGDMYNLESVGGVASGVMVLGQAKMSLKDPLRSIIGRTVLVHTNVDDGSQPYGNAGPPMAYGVIGLGNPRESSATDNQAQAPTVPPVDKIICTFEQTEASAITGTALLTLLEPCEPSDCEARMQAKLQGLNAGSAHSFHFHEWGDMSLDFKTAGELGSIYSSHGVDVSRLAVLSSGEAQYEAIYKTSDLVQHVGRSLTVHEGADSSTPTIAAAACGLANPLSTLETNQAPRDDDDGYSAGAVALLVIAVLAATLIVAVGVLYYFRKPIPLCGSCIYESDMLMVPPPPPKPTPVPSVPPPSVPPPVNSAV